MGVRDTSVEAYDAANASGLVGAQSLAILNTISEASQHGHRNMTRREIAAATGIEISSVSGRVNELVKRGLLYEQEQRESQGSKRKGWALALKTTEAGER